MITNLNAVIRQMKRIERGVLIGNSLVAAGVITEVASETVRRTPVDTGRARSTWEPSIGRPLTNDRPGITSRSRRQGRIKGRAAFRSFRLGQRGFVGSGLVYIGRLQEGHSRQAPSGFTFQTVQHAVRWANRNALRILERAMR